MKPKCHDCAHPADLLPGDIMKAHCDGVTLPDFKTSLGMVHPCHNNPKQPCIGHIQEIQCFPELQTKNHVQ